MVMGVEAMTGMLRRVFSRPRPWVMRYVLLTLPALVLAPLITFPFRAWFRYPLLVEALETQSLDLLLELLRLSSVEAPAGQLLGLAVLLILLTWVFVRGLWLWLEGGVLLTYVQAVPPSWREFFYACTRWLGSFLLLSVLGWLAIGLVGAAFAAAAFLGNLVWPPLATFTLGVGAVLVVACWLWVDFARVVAVVRDDRHVFRALTGAARVAGRRWLPLFGLMLGLLAVRLVVALASRALSSAMPYSWWLPTLAIQQLMQILAVGVSLIRRAGEAGLALDALATGTADG